MKISNNTATTYITPENGKVLQSKLTGAIYKDGIYLAKSLKPSDFDEVMIDEIDRSEDQEDDD